MRSAELIRQGVPKHAIAQACDRGMLIRLRRVWIAVPDADPALLRAARDGTVLTCITQAQRLGLWVLDGTCPHVAVPAHAGMVNPTGVVIHRMRPIVPRHPGSLVDPIENVLAVVAACQSFEAALAVWDSALHHKLVDPIALQRLPLGSKARELAAVASPFRDSGLETFVPVRLAWLKVPIVSQAWLAGHRVDFLIGERLVLQIDGGHHVGAQRAEDIEHDAQLMLLGYHVIRVGYDQVVNRWPAVQDLVMRAVAQGLHRAG